MNATGFYVAAALVVLSCAAAVGLRSRSHTGVAGAAVAVSIGIFLVVAGEYLLALMEVVLLLATLAVLAGVARRGGFGPATPPLPLSRWAYGLGLAALALVVLDGAALAAGTGWHSLGVKTALGSVLNHQAPVTVGLLVVAGVTAGLVALVIGRVGADEAAYHERHRALRERAERTRRRREDREAARRQRQAPRGGESG
jgi:signal transduction histidine kinase